MWYIFKNKQCVASCNFEPSIEDLESRNEVCIEHKEKFDINDIILDNNEIIIKPTIAPNNEQLLEIIRLKRNRLLKESDWTQFPDVQATFTEEKKKEWAVYRQALRDFPTTCDPKNPIYPVQPK